MSLKNILFAFSFIVSLVGGLISIAIFWVKGFELEEREIRIQAITLADLTKTPKIDGFNVEYTFNNKKIEGLTQLTLNCKNIGNKTIFGEGRESNLLNNNFKIRVGRTFKIVSLQAINNHISASLSLLDSNEIELRFIKWKPSEAVGITLFLEPQTNDTSTYPSLAFNDRELIDCEVSFSNNIDEFLIQHPITQVTKYLPFWIIKFAIYLTWAASIFCFFPFFIFLFTLIRSIIVYSNWKKKYQELLFNRIERLEDIDMDQKERFKKDIRKIPNDIWSKLKIPEPRFPRIWWYNLLGFISNLIILFVGFFNLMMIIGLFFTQ